MFGKVRIYSVTKRAWIIVSPYKMVVNTTPDPMEATELEIDEVIPIIETHARYLKDNQCLLIQSTIIG